MAVAKTATKAPAKAAPRSRTKPATTPVVEDEEVDLLSGLGDPVAEDEDEEFNLLDEITEDNGEAWKPADDEDIPEGIQGKVISVSSVETDQKYGGGTVPLLEIQEKSGRIWSVRGYHTVLRNQIEKNNPQVGDIVAIKYLGEKDNKKGDNSYQNYGMKCPKCDARK